MEGKVRVIIKRPDEKYGHVTNISTSLKNLQTNVGGRIQSVPLATFPDGKELIVICCDDALEKGYPYNCKVCEIDFLGDIIVAEMDGEEFTDLEISFDVWKNLVDNVDEINIGGD